MSIIKMKTLAIVQRSTGRPPKVRDVVWPLNSQEWPNRNFSSEYHYVYIFKDTGEEENEKDHLVKTRFSELN